MTKKNKLIHTPEGVRDIYNGECRRKLAVQEKILHTLYLYGYEHIQTPSFEYADIKGHTDIPLLKIESDFTLQSSGQLSTRLEAFAESLGIQDETKKEKVMGNEAGEWIIHGVTWDDPKCIHDVDEAVEYINRVGFLPLFKTKSGVFSGGTDSGRILVV